MKRLHLGPDFSVPADAATESWGFLGQRGSGKSNALVVMAEELHAAKVPWVAVDPKGDWWGIRSSADGKEAGLPVPVFGGLHADVPLEPSAGRLIADLLFDNVLSAVLDISRMTVTNMSRFLIDFFHQMFDRHQADPEVRMMLLEEAHRYIPQSVTAKTAELKEAGAKIPLEGRAFGLGSATASQRSSRLHKDVLTQFSIMVAMRSPAKLDRDAIAGWVEEQEVSPDFLRGLPSLKSGHAMLWSPHALERAEAVVFRQRRTFDSGATPKVGQTKRTPKTIADVDLGAITEAMAETVERAKEKDPAELLKRLKAAEAERDQALDTARRSLERSKTVEVPVLTDKEIDALQNAVEVVGAVARPLIGALEHISERLNAAVEGTNVRSTERSENGRKPPTPRSEPQTRGQNRKSAEDTPGDTDLSGAPRKILMVLAQQDKPMTTRRAGFLAGYSSRKSTVRNAVSALRQAGFIADVHAGTVEITQAGLDALGTVEPLPTGRELVSHWLREVGTESAPGRILLQMLQAPERNWTTDELAERAQIQPGTSTLRNAMSNLRQRGLVVGNHLDPDFVEAIR